MRSKPPWYTHTVANKAVGSGYSTKWSLRQYAEYLWRANTRVLPSKIKVTLLFKSCINAAKCRSQQSPNNRHELMSFCSFYLTSQNATSERDTSRLSLHRISRRSLGATCTIQLQVMYRHFVQVWRTVTSTNDFGPVWETAVSSTETRDSRCTQCTETPLFAPYF